MNSAGPVEQAFSAVLANRDGIADVGLSAAEVEAEACARSKVGDIRLDLRAALGDQASMRERCEGVAEHVSSWPEVEGAVGVPPRVYVLLRLGFLRESVTSAALSQGEAFGSGHEGAGRVALVSFSSPNANKPLHLGHLRNNVIGMALANLFAARGWRAQKGEVISDWGVHICQAVLGYLEWGESSTPKKAKEKPDHFVGRFYVRFHDEGDPVAEARATELLERMEAGDEELRRLNSLITGWAEQGIRKTYEPLGTRFDFVFREGKSRGLGKAVVSEALAAGRARRREDGSVCVELGGEMGEVTLLRRDGTPVVYTQLIGFHVSRFRKHPFDLCPTLLGREWESGANVVDEILRRWGYDFVDRIERVHYGMVRLREGRMKSRAGTTVSADSLLDRADTRLEDVWEAACGRPPKGDEREACRRLAVGVVKYLFLGVRRMKDILYDEDVLWERALAGFADAVRTLAWADGAAGPAAVPPLAADLRRLLNHLNGFPALVEQACGEREPAIVVRFMDELCTAVRSCRYGLDLGVRESVGIVLRRCFDLLNIELPSSLVSLPVPFAPATAAAQEFGGAGWSGATCTRPTIGLPRMQ